MKAIFKDSIYHKTKNKIKLLMVISIDQIHQTGPDFLKFCQLVNENSDRISNLILVETGHLKRHYIRIKQGISLKESAETGQALGRAWVENNLSSLNILKVPYQTITWQSLVQGDDFQEKLQLTLKDYQEDSIYKKIVDDVAGNYARKFYQQLKESGAIVTYDDCFEAAKSYLLEESAIAHKLVSLGDFQTYPGRGNPAVSYAYKKYFGQTDPLPWVRYKTNAKEKSQEVSNLPSCEAALPRSSLVDRSEISGGSSGSSSYGIGIFSQHRQQSKLTEMVVYTLDTLELTEFQQKAFMKRFIQLLADIQSMDSNEGMKNGKGHDHQAQPALH